MGIIPHILVSAFLAVLFLQSGIDKVIDRKGNLAWLTGYFAKSILKNMVAFNLTVITILEISAGALCAVGILEIAFYQTFVLSLYGTILSALSILCLFTGQRLAKDYAGAAGLVPYFILTVLGLTLLRY